MRAFAMVGAKLRQAPHRDAVLLVRPGELEPEITLCHSRGGAAAGDEEAQRGVAMQTELMNARLQCAELFRGSARQKPESLPGLIRAAHTRRSASNCAVDSSSSAI